MPPTIFINGHLWVTRKIAANPQITFINYLDKCRLCNKFRRVSALLIGSQMEPEIQHQEGAIEYSTIKQLSYLILYKYVKPKILVTCPTNPTN
jgi:hypothetical protein